MFIGCRWVGTRLCCVGVKRTTDAIARLALIRLGARFSNLSAPLLPLVIHVARTHALSQPLTHTRTLARTQPSNPWASNHTCAICAIILRPSPPRLIHSLPMCSSFLVPRADDPVRLPTCWVFPVGGGWLGECAHRAPVLAPPRSVGCCCRYPHCDLYSSGGG